MKKSCLIAVIATLAAVAGALLVEVTAVLPALAGVRLVQVGVLLALEPEQD